MLGRHPSARPGQPRERRGVHGGQCVSAAGEQGLVTAHLGAHDAMARHMPWGVRHAAGAHLAYIATAAAAALCWMPPWCRAFAAELHSMLLPPAGRAGGAAGCRGTDSGACAGPGCGLGSPGQSGSSRRRASRVAAAAGSKLCGRHAACCPAGSGQRRRRLACRRPGALARVSTQQPARRSSKAPARHPSLQPTPPRQGSAHAPSNCATAHHQRGPCGCERGAARCTWRRAESGD